MGQRGQCHAAERLGGPCKLVAPQNAPLYMKLLQTLHWTVIGSIMRTCEHMQSAGGVGAHADLHAWCMRPCAMRSRSSPCLHRRCPLPCCLTFFSLFAALLPLGSAAGSKSGGKYLRGSTRDQASDRCPHRGLSPLGLHAASPRGNGAGVRRTGPPACRMRAVLQPTCSLVENLALSHGCCWLLREGAGTICMAREGALQVVQSGEFGALQVRDLTPPHKPTRSLKRSRGRQ